MVNKSLLELLRCPACVKTSPGLLEQVHETWLICTDCGRKYPIVEDIPVMLISEGDRWKTTSNDDLPVPPPQPQ